MDAPSHSWPLALIADIEADITRRWWRVLIQQRLSGGGGSNGGEKKVWYRWDCRWLMLLQWMMNIEAAADRRAPVNFWPRRDEETDQIGHGGGSECIGSSRDECHREETKIAISVGSVAAADMIPIVLEIWCTNRRCLLFMRRCLCYDVVGWTKEVDRQRNRYINKNSRYIFRIGTTLWRGSWSTSSWDNETFNPFETVARLFLVKHNSQNPHHGAPTRNTVGVIRQPSTPSSAPKLQRRWANNPYGQPVSWRRFSWPAACCVEAAATATRNLRSRRAAKHQDTNTIDIIQHNRWYARSPSPCPSLMYIRPLSALTLESEAAYVRWMVRAFRPWNGGYPCSRCNLRRWDKVMVVGGFNPFHVHNLRTWYQ